MEKHIDKRYFSILKETDYNKIDDYLILKDGFNITEDALVFDMDIKDLIDSIKQKYKFIKYRLQYGSTSIFFHEENIKYYNQSNIYKYYTYDIDYKNKSIKHTYPINLKFKNNDGSNEILNNHILNFFYDNVIENTEDKSNMKNGNLYYNKENKSLFICVDYLYKNIIDLLISGDIILEKTYEYNGIPLKNALTYNNRIIGSLKENDNFLYLKDSLNPTININGFDFNLFEGISAFIEEDEEFLYYPTIDKMVGTKTYNEYESGNILYIKELNELFIVNQNGLIKIDRQNLIYSFDYPDNVDISDIGRIWIDKNSSTLNIYNGEIWVPMNTTPLILLGDKIASERNFGSENSNKMILEVYGYNDQNEFNIISMNIPKDMTMDIEFPIGVNFIDSVFVNGNEIYAYDDATYGIHLHNPLLKGDKIDIVYSNKKKYIWVSGNEIDSSSIMLSNPYHIVFVKKLFLNEDEYFVTKSKNNTIKVNDLISLNEINDMISLNHCSRIYAKVKIDQTKLSQAYPTFSIDYEENLKEIDLPFEIKNGQFDNIMITNKGEEVIINPKIILYPNKLYAFYDINIPTKIRFNRYIEQEDCINIQYVSHKRCIFGPNSYFEHNISESELEDKIIMDSVLSFEDELTSLPLLYEKIEHEHLESKDPVIDVDKKNIIGSLPSVSSSKNTNSDDINELIEQSTLKSNPDISIIATINRSIPSNSEKPIMARPSRIVEKPVVIKKSKNNKKFNKYYFEITNSFMEYREKVKKYLEQFSKYLKMSSDYLTRIRDSFQAMINYICNMLCLEDLLKAAAKILDNIMKGIESLLNLSLKEMLEKIKNMLDSITKKIKESIEKLWEMVEIYVDSLIQKIKDFVNGVLVGIGKAIDTAVAAIEGVIDSVNGVLSKIQSLFNLFTWTNIGKSIGQFFVDTIQQVMGFFSRIFLAIEKFFLNLFEKTESIKKRLKNINEDIKKWSTDDFRISFKRISFSTYIDGIMDLICNKILGNILDTLTGLIDILNHLQKRYQDFIDKTFTVTYKSKLNSLDSLITAGDFFKSYVNICDILKEMLLTNDFTLAGFIKRVTNLEKIIKTWISNKNTLKKIANNQLIGDGNRNGEANDFGSAMQLITNSVLGMDELIGIWKNPSAIKKIVNNLKRSYIPNFQAKSESIVDTQAMSKQLFDYKRFKNLSKKVTFY